MPNALTRPLEYWETANKFMNTSTTRLDADIAAHPFVREMSEHHIHLLADCATRTDFDAGQVIFRQGESADRFYLLEQGKVAVESASKGAEPVTVDIIGPGDLLGWSWAFPPYVWHFDARALEPTKVIFVNGTLLREYCERDHTLGYELFKRISKVMMLRLQRARLCILADRVEGEPEGRDS
jgi:CRP/FNR family transcriptional regulator, cyclic AMP receptor protein